MNRFFSLTLGILLCMLAGAAAQSASELNAGSQLTYTGTTGAYTFSWWGISGNTYLIETSDDLINWAYLPVVESGSNSVIEWGLTSTSTNLFLKLEYITVPPGQLTGQAFNGPDNDGDGLPDDWELFYFGHTGVNPSDYVPWSGGTITNLQAYQQGLNPTDFYNGTLPSLTAITGTSLPYESGSTATLSVQVTDALGHPIPGAPVIYSIDYGLLVFPDGSGGSQEVEVAADSNGYANVTLVEPLWQGIPYTVTAKAETGGLTTSVQFTGETESDDPAAPPLPSPALPNPNLISEPTLSVAISSTSVGNPAFEEYPTYDAATGQYDTYAQPVKWYLTQTENASWWEVPEGEDEPYYYDVEAGTLSTSGSIAPLFGAEMYSGTCVTSDTLSSYGVVESYFNVNGTEMANGTWNVLGTGSNPEQGIYTTIYAGLYTPYTPATTALSPTEEYLAVNSDDYISSDDIVLSNQYTSQQFTTDVLNNLPSPSASYGGYSPGDTIAWWELADDSSSFSVGEATYQFTCATTGTAPYVFEWYEVFQPDDDTQPIQVTHQEWDNANLQAESPTHTIDVTSAGEVNGTWYIARLDTQTYSQYPECQWRHVIGIGELINMSLPGLPVTIGTAATWSITPSTSGSLTVTSTTSAYNSFRAGRNPGTVTITATLPGGATMSTTLTIIAPSGVAYTKITPYSIPWWAIGAGMWGQYTLLPTTVSFYGCEFQEEKCQATNPSGFFKQTNLLLWHNPNTMPSSSLSQPPDSNPQWITIQQDNSGGQLDLASAIANLFAVAVYDDSCNLGEEGSGFEWQIPLRYRLMNDTDNGVAFPTPVTQSMQISGAYGSFVLKGDASDYR